MLVLLSASECTLHEAEILVRPPYTTTSAIPGPTVVIVPVESTTTIEVSVEYQSTDSVVFVGVI